jgi:hypothetical protein
MLRVPSGVLLASWALIAACTDAPSSGLPDASDAPDADSGSRDAGLPSDSGSRDAGLSTDGGPGSDAAASDTGVATATAAAVLDRRCDPLRRLGVIDVNDDSGAQRGLSASIDDRPPPWIGPPTATSADCRLYQVAPGPCNCAPQACDYRGQCAPFPEPIPGYVIRVISAAGEESFTADLGGVANGLLQGPQTPLALAIRGPGILIDVPFMDIPPELSNLSGMLDGTYDAPRAVDVRWDPVTAAQVYTRIPINHHIGSATNTECVVAASAGQFHVDQAMLVPLALVTGLEFQGVEHVRFASAELPSGCLEVRFRRHHYLSLF